MRIIADLHLHSHFSRATSPKMIPEEIEFWAYSKGINIVGTGDCSHPGWVKELREKLIFVEKTGLYRLKPESSKLKSDQWSMQKGPFFLITGEISSIYKHSYKVRKIHTLFFVPSFEVLENINNKLAQIGNIAYDGRPIIGISALELARVFWQADPMCEVIPAHIWTPWFSLFGSKSGYDLLTDCYGEDSDKIYCLETGLSSDLNMNWRISMLDKYTFISNSDAHSLINLSREATIFDLENISYKNIIDALHNPKRGFIGTVEFFPEEGKYHNDGHRACKVNVTPAMARSLKNMCPSCGKELVLGVLHRVDALADRAEGSRVNPNHKVYYAIPLIELIAQTTGLSKTSKFIQEKYILYLQTMPELEILLFTDLIKLKKIIPTELIDAIDKMRQGQVSRVAGYDGEYGIISVNNNISVKQKTLFQ